MNAGNAKKFVNSVIKVIEHLSRAEITKYAYKIILNYLDEYDEYDYSACARYTVKKYLSRDIPTLEEIRQKHKAAGRLDELDKLVLKMEYEAEKLKTG